MELYTKDHKVVFKLGKRYVIGLKKPVFTHKINLLN